MASNLSFLLIVLSISSLTFIYLSQAVKPVVNASDYRSWAISWLGLTAISFVIPNALMLLVLSGLFIFWISKKVENKVALYFMVSYVIQGYIHQTPLLNVSYQTILGITILLPLFFGIMVEKKDRNTPKSLADLFLILYLLLVYILMFRGLTTKSSAGYTLTYPSMVKIGATYFLQYFLPYFVISRYFKRFEQVKTGVFAIVSFCMLLAPLAVYEIATTSTLYGSIPENLGVEYDMAFVMRAGLLRATASIDHPLNLGMLMMIALSLFIFVSHYIKNKLLVLIGFGLLTIGFIAPLSKGPWSGGALSLIVIYLLSPNKLKNGFLAVAVMSVTVGILLANGYSDKVISLLPFVGTEDTGTTDYRALLFKQSLIVIDEFPLFGMYEPTLHDAMLPLYQGEGIVDLVNVYITIALQSGLVGLFLFSSFLLIVVFSLLKELILFKDKRSLEYLCGNCLLASLLAMLAVMISVSNTIATSTILLSLCGLSVSFTNIFKKERKKTIGDLATYSTSRNVGSSSQE